MSTFEQMTLPGLVKKEKHSIKRGPFGGSLKKNIFVSSGYKVYEQQHVIQNDFSLGRYFITEQKYKEMEGFSVCPGDFLISCSGTIGRIAIVPDGVKKGIINQALLKISLDPHKILPNYFKYLFESDLIQKRLTKISRGVAIKNVPSVKELKEIFFPVPDMDLQNKILQCIEIQFTRLDATINSLKTIKIKLDLYYKSVLKSSFDRDWQYDKLGKIFETSSGGTPSRSERKYYTGNIPWLKSGELNDNMNIVDSEEYITSEAVKNSSAKKFPSNTVLIALYGATTGKLGILRKESTTNQAVCGILPQKEYLPEFIFYYLLSKRTYLISQAKGGAQPNINQGIVGNTDFPKIDEKIQREVIDSIESRLSVIDKLKIITDGSLKKVEKLRKSILKSAFEGKLVN